MKTEMLYVLMGSIAVFFFVSADGDIRCKYDEFVVDDVVGKVSCVKCRKCPLGMGLTPQCGSRIRYGTKIECKHCIKGETYSSNFSIESCQPCDMCSDHQDMLEKCNITHNSRCAKSCDTGFYLSPVVGDCQECSWCCSDSSPSSYEKQCKKSGVPFYKQCTIGESLRCQPHCTNKQYVFVSKTLNKACSDCPICAVGKGLYPRCQSILTSSMKAECYNCIPGTNFSDSIDSSSCKKCTVCGVGKKIERNCNRTHDTLCGDCNPGFYKDETKCKECSLCCGDELDKIVHECREQGMAKERQCSYTTRAITKCASTARKHDNKIYHLIVIIMVLLVLVIIGLSTCFWYFKRGSKKINYQSLNNESQMEEKQEKREFPSSASSATNIDFKKSGIRVECQDVEVMKDLRANMSVEICWDDHKHLPNTQYIYLSPLTRFECNTNITAREIKLEVPHSAYKEVGNTWEIKVLKQTSPGNSGSPMELTELNDPEMIVNACSVKFTVRKLGAFIIAGVPGDPKHAKKRMHFGVFGADPNIGHTCLMNIYLFDDNESFLQKLKVQEKREGHQLLTLLHSMYPDVGNERVISVAIEGIMNGCKGNISTEEFGLQEKREGHNLLPNLHSMIPDVDMKSVIGVAIEGIMNGWEGNISTETIQSVEWRDSYRRAPMIKATFHNTDPQITDFNTTFKFIFNDTTLLVPVVINELKLKDIPVGIQPSETQNPSEVHIGIEEHGESSFNPSLSPTSSYGNVA